MVFFDRPFRGNLWFSKSRIFSNVRAAFPTSFPTRFPTFPSNAPFRLPFSNVCSNAPLQNPSNALPSAHRYPRKLKTINYSYKFGLRRSRRSANRLFEHSLQEAQFIPLSEVFRGLFGCSYGFLLASFFSFHRSAGYLFTPSFFRALLG